jgi:L-ascorbate metabolism protein UlaG (beta-lactamase superfamily)
MVDVMIVPVGGNGYTLDGIGALKLIKKIEPKVVIPTHFDDRSLTFPVPQQPLDQALKSLAMEPKETVSKLRLKGSELGDLSQLIVLEKA